MNPLEIFARICAEVVQGCGPDADMAKIETAIRSRLDDLPPNERDAVEAAMEALTAYRAPGFHEHGPH